MTAEHGASEGNYTEQRDYATWVCCGKTPQQVLQDRLLKEHLRYIAQFVLTCYFTLYSVSNPAKIITSLLRLEFK